MNYRKLRRRHWVFFSHLTILIAALGAGYALEQFRTDHHVEDTRRELTITAETLSALVERELADRVFATQRIVAKIAAQPDMSKASFETIASQVHKRDPGIVSITLAPDYVISQVYPVEANRSVLGLNLLESDAVAASIETAVKEHAVAFEGPVDLVQGGRGFITRAPVIKFETTEREEKIWGVVSIFFDEVTFYEDAGLLSEGRGWDAALRVIEPFRSSGEIFFGDPEVFLELPVVRQIPLLGHRWEIGLIPSNGWPTAPPGRSASLLASVAVGAIAMIAFQIFSNLITQRSLARQQLIQAIEALDDGFALYDSDEILVLCNQQYRSIYEISADVIRPGNSFETIIREGVARGQYVEAIGQEEAWLKARVAQHREANIELEQHLADGRWLKISERKTADGSTVGFRVDITELKEARLAAEKANEAKTNFLNNISHEFRTPLTVILGFVAFMRQPDTLKSVQEFKRNLGKSKNAQAGLDAILVEFSSYSERIHSSASHLLSLVEGILDLAAVEAGQLRLDKKTQRLSDLIYPVLDQLEARIKEKGLLTSCSVEKLDVLVDPVRIRQVLINLLDNAIKFTESGGRISVDARIVGAHVQVEIQDTGCGVRTGDRERIFDRFTQSDPTTSRVYGGAGLGLAISREIVEMHGGSIGVNAPEGHGSCFWFTVPRAPATAETEDFLLVASL